MATPKRDSISSRFLKRAASGKKPLGSTNDGVRRVQIQTNKESKNGTNSRWENQPNDNENNTTITNNNNHHRDDPNFDLQRTQSSKNGAVQSQRPLPKTTSTPQPKMSSIDPLSLITSRRESPDFAAQLDDFGILYEEEPPSLPVEERGVDAVYVRDSLPV